ncbi:TraB/GumN family protein [Sphingomonas sp.]|uniref:TraB/GumN family protein n=1 Tax=Sphingomonas sp. TaxID=28214 RepID=UPI002C8B97C7|nr:TraB/GumN family protein [Sphingomonas sp.]HWK36039.1 TraB/GumN family protein [Sphingomonas sp.]
MRSLTSIAAALLAALPLPACAQSAPAPEATVADADPALWVVKDEDTTIYLFGTVHVLKPGLTWFDEAVKAAFDKSDSLVLELVQPAPEAMQAIVMKNAVTPQDAPALTDRLPAEKRDAYVKAVTGIGAPANAFDRYAPWFAAVNLSLVPLMKAGYDPRNGPEGVLTAAAKAAKKPVTGLETAEQQIGYFGGLSEKAQMTFLTGTLDELPRAEATMATMVDDWSRGNPDALAKMLNDNLKDSPEVAETLLYKRNANWAKWIAERMKQPGTVFVAVGAGHLAGDRSVIADLKAHQLTAERIEY